MLAVVFLLITQVLPVFDRVFAQLGVRMSPMAVRLMQVGDVLSGAGLGIAIALCALAVGQESTVLELPDATGYPIRLETVTGATADGVITARGTWHDQAGNEWHVMFSGAGAQVKVVDADTLHKEW